MADRARAAARVTRRSTSAAGAFFVAYGDGRGLDRQLPSTACVARVDPRTNARHRAVRIGAAQALAAGAGSAWVSAAGGTQAGTLPAPACDARRVRRRDARRADRVRPPARRATTPTSRARSADAIRSCSSEHGFRAGRYIVGYQSCDESTAQTGNYENRRCAANANAYARAEQARGGDRPVQLVLRRSSQIPILNRAPGGPLALISPTNTDPGLTRGPPIVPRARARWTVYYPTGARNYARVIGRADVEGVALALLAQRLRLARVYLLDPDDRVDGVDQRDRVGAAALGRLGRLADVGDVGRQLDDHRHAGMLLAPARDHLDIFRHLADGRAHAALGHAVRAAEIELDAVGAGVLDPRRGSPSRLSSSQGTISETTRARSGQRRFTSLISRRFTSSGRSVISSMLLKPITRRSGAVNDAVARAVDVDDGRVLAERLPDDAAPAGVEGALDVVGLVGRAAPRRARTGSAT